MFAQNEPVAALHNIERGTEHTSIATEQIGPRRGGKHGPQFGKYAKFATHIMRRLNLVSQWRPAEHKFRFSPAQQIGQIRVSMRKLLDRQRLGRWPQKLAEIRL